MKLSKVIETHCGPPWLTEAHRGPPRLTEFQGTQRYLKGPQGTQNYIAHIFQNRAQRRIRSDCCTLGMGHKKAVQSLISENKMSIMLHMHAKFSNLAHAHAFL